MTDGDPSERLAAFKEAMVGASTTETLVERYVLHGACYAIDEERHYDLKTRIAAQFGINGMTETFVVGSAKLGFSISPTKRYQFFGNRSDVDVAIVSHELYQRVWHEVHDYSISGADWPEREKFEKYLAWGWIRPDKLPRSASFAFTNEWWDFFRSLQSARVAGPHKVAAALYHDYEFLVRYQKRAMAACRTEEGEHADVGNQQEAAHPTDRDSR